MPDNIIRREYTEDDFYYISYMFAPVTTAFQSFEDYKKETELYWKIREQQFKEENKNHGRISGI